MRLFIAINLPKDIRNKIWMDFAYSKDSLEFAAFTLPENLHITLAFLGELDESTVPKIKSILTEISSKIGPHPIRINGCKIGPSETIPRMLWLEMDNNAETFIRALTQLIRKELDSKSINYDKTYGVNAHITLARFSDRWQQLFLSKNDKQKNDEVKKIKDVLPESVSLPFEANSIILFQSTQENGERVYKPLFESELKQ